MQIAILLAVILGIALVIILSAWGTATAATGVTLAVSNATLSAANLASQAVMLLLACALTAVLPLAIYGAVRLAVQLKEREHRHTVTDQTTPPIRIAQAQPRSLGEGRVIVMQLPESTQAQRVVRHVRRATRPMRQAVRLTRRWFA